MRLKFTAQSSSKIATDVRQLAADDEAGELEVIIKTIRPDYVPDCVAERARIDQVLFTGVVQAGALEQLADDPAVETVSVAQPLKVID